MHYMGMAATRFVATSPLIYDDVNANCRPHLYSYCSRNCNNCNYKCCGSYKWYGSISYVARRKVSRRVSLNAILGTAIDGIVTIDHTGIILSFNESASKIFGWHENEVQNHNIKMLMDDAIATHHDSYLLHAKNVDLGKVIGVNREIFAKHKNGHLFPIRLGIGEVNQPGQNPLYVGFITDLSEQRALQKSLEEKEQKYRSLNG